MQNSDLQVGLTNRIRKGFSTGFFRGCLRLARNRGYQGAPRATMGVCNSRATENVENVEEPSSRKL